MYSTYLIGALGGLALIMGLFLALYYISNRHRPLGEAKGHPKKEDIETDFILDTIEDGVVLVDQNNQIKVFNPAASRISGWPSAEALGLDYRMVLPLVDEKGQGIADDKQPFKQALLSGKSVHDSHAILATRSGTLPISLIISPVQSHDDQPAGSIVAVFRDIAKEAKEEQQRSDFISTASHEMRTPLAAIEGYLALALNPKTAKIDENAQRYLEKASTSTTHLGELFRDLLTSSKAEDGRLISYPAVIEIGEILEQVVDAGRIRATEKRLEMRYSISNDQSGGGKAIRPLYYAYADPNRIREVFQNIIDNAVKYTASGGIEVRLTGDDKITQIQIKDSGVGIAAADIPHLFQKFYRVDNSTTRTIGGTGLGLFICREVVELYSGRIWVESEPGKGSTFFINLPRISTQQALSSQPDQPTFVAPLKQKV
jgi:two-component system, OmpR family, sensor histidine kinase VicK